MVKTYYCYDTTNHVGSDGSDNRDLEITSGTTTNLDTPNANPGPETLYFYAPTNEPNLTSWQNGTYTWYLDVSSANANLELTSVTLHRYDSTLATSKANKSSTENTALSSVTTYSNTIDWSDGTQNPGGAAASDRFVIAFSFTRIGGAMGPQSVTLDVVGSADSRVDTPLEGLTSVSQTNIHKYDITAYATQTNIQKYDILNTVSQSNIEKYDILNDISQTSIQKYDMLEYILQQNIHKYDIFENILENSIHKYHILNPVSQDNIQKYNILENILQSSIHKYNLFENIVQSSIQKYDIFENIIQSSIQKYDILNNIIQTSIGKYDILNNVIQNTIQKYDIINLNFVSQTTIQKYHIFENIISSNIQKYNILNNIIQASIEKYDILNNVLQSNIHKYDIIENIIQTTIHKYDIISDTTVIASNIMKYNIYEYVLQPTIQKYHILNTIAQQTIQKYNIFENILQSTINKYNIIQNIAQSTINKYDILNNIANSSISKYNILNNVIQSVIKKYNIFQNATQTSVHKYDIISNVVNYVLASIIHKYKIENLIDIDWGGAPDRTKKDITLRVIPKPGSPEIEDDGSGNVFDYDYPVIIEIYTRDSKARGNRQEPQQLVYLQKKIIQLLELNRFSLQQYGISHFIVEGSQTRTVDEEEYGLSNWYKLTIDVRFKFRMKHDLI